MTRGLQRKKRLLLVGLLLLLAAAGSPARGGETIEAIVAVVGEEVITLSEMVDFCYQQMLQNYGPEWPKQTGGEIPPEVQQQALDFLVERKLFLREANRLELRVPENKIENELTQLRKRFSTPEELYKEMTKTGVTENKVRLQIEEQLRVNELQQQYLRRAKITVDEKDARSFYEEHKELFRIPEEVNISQILLRRSEKKARERGEEIVEKLREGADFTGLAREYSEGPNAAKGGAVGFLARGEILPEIEKAVFALEPGEVSGLLESRYSFHIIKVNSRKEGRQRSFSEVEGEIRRELRERKRRELLRKLTEKLKKGTYLWIQGES